jgi:hypothetical protein
MDVSRFFLDTGACGDERVGLQRALALPPRTLSTP